MSKLAEKAPDRPSLHDVRQACSNAMYALASGRLLIGTAESVNDSFARPRQDWERIKAAKPGHLEFGQWSITADKAKEVSHRPSTPSELWLFSADRLSQRIDKSFDDLKQLDESLRLCERSLIRAGASLSWGEIHKSTTAHTAAREYLWGLLATTHIAIVEAGEGQDIFQPGSSGRLKRELLLIHADRIADVLSKRQGPPAGLESLIQRESVLAEDLAVPPPSLTPEQTATLVALLDLGGLPGRDTWSAAKIADRAHSLFGSKVIPEANRDSVRRHLESLRKMQLVEVVGRGKGSGYLLTNQGLSEAESRR